MRILYTFAVAFFVLLAGLHSGCATTSRNTTPPSILVMTIREGVWYRCLVMPETHGASLSWIITPSSAVSDHDDITVQRRLTVNQWEALYGLLATDPELARWRLAPGDNFTLDEGLIMTLTQAAHAPMQNYDIPPAEGQALSAHILGLLGFAQIAPMATL
jgi:hypothetical protein